MGEYMVLDHLRSIPQKSRGILAMLLAFAQHARDERAPDYDPTAGLVQRAAQVGTIISVIVIAVVALVGTLILAQINSALPEISNTQLNSSSQSILDGFSGAMELVPVVLLVLVAALVIGVVQRLRG